MHFGGSSGGGGGGGGGGCVVQWRHARAGHAVSAVSVERERETERERFHRQQLEPTHHSEAGHVDVDGDAHGGVQQWRPIHTHIQPHRQPL